MHKLKFDPICWGAGGEEGGGVEREELKLNFVSKDH